MEDFLIDMLIAILTAAMIFIAVLGLKWLYKCIKKAVMLVTRAINNRHRVAVDLGLSVKWATCNVGAKKPSDFGSYYAWGETTEKKEYTTANCITWQEEMSDISRSAQYDVAYRTWGSSWRMPTIKECEELVNNCTWRCDTIDGHNGYQVTGPNGNSIFLPEESGGFYWSSIPENDTWHAYCMYFYMGELRMSYVTRYYGRSVRPVSD